MAFGGFAPLPLRLGGSPTEGWTAAQHARLAADLVAADRVAPLARLTVNTSTGAVTTYHGRNGVGLAYAPTVTVNADSTVVSSATLSGAGTSPPTVTLAGDYEDAIDLVVEVLDYRGFADPGGPLLEIRWSLNGGSDWTTESTGEAYFGTWSVSLGSFSLQFPAIESNNFDTDNVYTPQTTFTPGLGVTLQWARAYTTTDGRREPWVLKSAKACAQSTTARMAVTTITSAGALQVYLLDRPSGTEADGLVTVVVNGTWGRFAEIGDYDGDLEKEDDQTEHPVPYAAAWYRDLQEQRGSAYTKRSGTLVHCENLAIARQQAAIGSRLPDKLRNQATPRRADEGLEYWSTVLGVPRQSGEPKWSLRKRCNIHFRAVTGNSFPELELAIRELIGPAFVSLELQHTGDTLEDPAASTYWPNNVGSSIFDIGGGTWLSEKAHVLIEVQRPGGMSEGQFSQLVNVQLFQLVDRMLPAWTTARWQLEDGEGAFWGAFDWADGTEWTSSFSWNV